MDGIRAAFTGRLGADCEIKTIRTTGAPFASFPVCVDTTKEAEAVTSWVKVALFGDEVAAMTPRLLKGAEIYCEGRLSLRSWTGTNGEKRSGLSLATARVTIMGVSGEGRDNS